MKKQDYILALILTLTIIFAIRTSEAPCEHKSILTEIQGLKTAILSEIDTIEVDKALLDRIDELTRQNVVLLQEVADQAKQIKEFGWMKEENQ